MVLQESTWHLRTARCSYAVSWTATGQLRLLHWGSPLTDESVERLAARAQPRIVPAASYHGAVHDEIAVPDGIDQRELSLAVRHADGSTGLRLTLVGAVHDGADLTLTLQDADHAFEVDLRYRAQPEFDVIERWIELRNRSAGAHVDVVTAFSAALRIPEAATRVTYLTGQWAADPQLARTALPRGRFGLASTGGQTSHHAKPWFAVDDGNSTETAGEVWSAALAWSGSWRLSIEETYLRTRHAVFGINDDGLTYRLAPGETLTLPTVALVYSGDGFGGTSDRLHEYQRQTVLRDRSLRKVLYNSWEATHFDVTAAGQLQLARRAAQIGCELFVVDDGWFRGRVDEHAGLGDWSPDPAKFPGGLEQLIDSVRELGMEFGLWIEPEMVSPDSDLYRAHPHWVFGDASITPATIRSQLVLNLARPDVRDYVLRTVDDLLCRYDIRYLKWDFNRPITEWGWPGEANPERAKILYVRNLYGILRELRRAHPDVTIEACAGGGGRTDLGMLSLVDQVWTSDDSDPYDRLSLQHAYSFAFPANTMVSWVTPTPSLLNGRVSSLTYRFHVAMCGVLGVGDDLTAWSEEDAATAAALIAYYKANREVIQYGRLSRLRHDDEVTVVQYTGQDADVILVFGFGHGRRFAREDESVRLVLDRAVDGVYRTDSGELFGADELRATGIVLTLRGDLTSSVVRLERVTG
jgi:alpha-galactosidase